MSNVTGNVTASVSTIVVSVKRDTPIAGGGGWFPFVPAYGWCNLLPPLHDYSVRRSFAHAVACYPVVLLMLCEVIRFGLTHSKPGSGSADIACVGLACEAQQHVDVHDNYITNVNTIVCDCKP